MSWWSDGEPFDEHDPEYCKNCNWGFSKAECDRCAALYEQEEEESDVDA